MDDILYIILGIAWLVWSLYSNKLKQDKKKAAQMEERERRLRENEFPQSDTDKPFYNPYEESVSETPQEMNHPRRSLFEELLGEEFPVYEEHKMEEAQSEQFEMEIDEQKWRERQREYEKPETSSLEIIREEVPHDYFERQYKQIYNNENQPVARLIIREEEEITETELLGSFDLQKAIIYSEILRAPYVSEGS